MSSSLNPDRFARLIDRRTPADIFNQAWRLAQTYFPTWTGGYPSGYTPDFKSHAISDPGIVLLRLFSSLLAGYAGEQLNRTPENQRLSLYDFFGLAPPVASVARAPIIFQLAQDAAPVTVAAGAAVAALDPSISFELLEDITVLPLIATRIVCIDPDRSSFTIRGTAPSEQPVDESFVRRLCIGDDQAFNLSSPTQELQVTLTGTGLSANWFKAWTMELVDYKLAVAVDAAYDRLVATLKIVPDPGAASDALPAATLESLNAYAGRAGLVWLAVAPDPSEPVIAAQADQLPYIGDIQARLAETSGVLPEFTSANDAPLDIKKGAFPLGEIPAINDSFYIGASAFSLTGAQIKLVVSVTPVVGPAAPQLTWEYWDGSVWANLAVSDGTNSFMQSGEIRFSIANPIIEAEVNGQTSYWIRARLVAGGYGQSGQTVITYSAEQILGMIPDSVLCGWGATGCEQRRAALLTWFTENSINFGFKYIPPEYYPPFIQSLLVKYEFSRRPGAAFTYNNFAWNSLASSGRPYAPWPDPAALYLALEPSTAADWSGRKLQLYLLLEENPAALSAAQTWSLWNGSVWTPLVVEDGTENLQSSGPVVITLPADTAPTAPLELPPAIWIRIAGAGIVEASARLLGVWTNAAEAAGRLTIENEILGSSAGQPDLSFSLSNHPVLDLTLDVYESANDEAEDDDSDAAVAAAAPPDAVASANDDATMTLDGSPPGVWRLWRQVDSFVWCGPDDRVFQLNSQTGTVVFGNGVRGMAPPAGSNNIRALRYSTPLAAVKANVPSGALTVLQTSAPGIESVTNPVPAVGAVDAQSRPVFSARSPALLRARNRALLGDDFAALALAASPEVASAHVVATPGVPGVTVVILAASALNQYRPPLELLQATSAYLKERALACAADRIQVIGPEYYALDMTVRVALDEAHATREGRTERLRQEIRACVALHFDALCGGENGAGWNPGAAPRRAAIAARIGELAFVRAVEVRLANEAALAPHQFPAPGVMHIQFTATANARMAREAARA